MNLVEFLGVGIAFILAVTLHEAAHGVVAFFLGDDTASKAGRVTLNPMAHVDPIGSIILPGALMLAGTPFLFGYAKPVPVNFNRLRFKNLGVILVAGAGPCMNFMLALLAACLLHINGDQSTLGNDILVHSVRMNVILCVFNLLPILPFDGGRILHALSPRTLKTILEKIEPYTFFGLLMLLWVPFLTQYLLSKEIDIFRMILMPPYELFLRAILTITGHSA